MLSVWKLAKELVASGWRNDRKLVILAARYYNGIDSREVLEAYLDADDVAFVVRMR